MIADMVAVLEARGYEDVDLSVWKHHVLQLHHAYGSHLITESDLTRAIVDSTDWDTTDAEITMMSLSEGNATHEANNWKDYEDPSEVILRQYKQWGLGGRM